MFLLPFTKKANIRHLFVRRYLNKRWIEREQKLNINKMCNHVGCPIVMLCCILDVASLFVWHICLLLVVLHWERWNLWEPTHLIIFTAISCVAKPCRQKTICWTIVLEISKIVRNCTSLVFSCFVFERKVNDFPCMLLTFYSLKILIGIKSKDK